MVQPSCESLTSNIRLTRHPIVTNISSLLPTLIVSQQALLLASPSRQFRPYKISPRSRPPAKPRAGPSHPPPPKPPPKPPPPP